MVVFLLWEGLTISVNQVRDKMIKNIGLIMLAVFLILWGLMQIIPAIGVIGIFLAIFAIITGIVLLTGR